MPALETLDRHQEAAYWEASGITRHGEKKVKNPIQIKVRWETKHEVILDSQGNQVAVDTFVVTDLDIPLGSILRLGKLAEVPSSPNNLKEVVAKRDVPDVKNRNNRRTLILTNHGDTLPTIAS